MKWILDHLQLVVVIASAFAWWLSQRREQQAPPPDPMDRPGRQKIDYEEGERTRQIQEDIRRRIAERRNGGAGTSRPGQSMPEPRMVTDRPSPQATKPPVPQIPPILRELMGLPADEAPPPPRLPQPVQESINPVLERQNRLAAELRALEAQRAENEALARSTLEASSYRSTRRAVSAQSTMGDDYLATLRDRRSVRRAMVLREILDKPVALR
jgi:hypothetical protein